MSRRRRIVDLFTLYILVKILKQAEKKEKNNEWWKAERRKRGRDKKPQPIGIKITDEQREQQQDREWEEKKKRWAEKDFYTPANHGRKRVYLESSSPVTLTHGMRCIACHEPITGVGSTLVSMFVRWGQRIMHGKDYYRASNMWANTVRELSFPERVKGWICESCYDELRNEQVPAGEDEKGNKKFIPKLIVIAEPNTHTNHDEGRKPSRNVLWTGSGWNEDPSKRRKS